MSKEVSEKTPVTRTSSGLREVMFEEIDAIRNGKSNPTRANAVAKLASGIVDTVRMEIDLEKHLSSSSANAKTVEASNGLLGRNLQLGS